MFSLLGNSRTHSRHPSQDFVSSLKDGGLSPARRKSNDLLGSGSLSPQVDSGVPKEQEIEAANPCGASTLPSGASTLPSGTSTLSSGASSLPSELTQPTEPPTTPQPPAKPRSLTPLGSNLSDLATLEQIKQLDNLSLSCSPKKKRITKEDFKNSTGNLTANLDPNDPLSQLNPLWSLK